MNVDLPPRVGLRDTRRVLEGNIKGELGGEVEKGRGREDKKGKKTET